MEGNTRNGKRRTTLTKAGFRDKSKAGKSPHRSLGTGVAFCFFGGSTILCKVINKECFP